MRNRGEGGSGICIITQKTSFLQGQIFRFSPAWALKNDILTPLQNQLKYNRSSFKEDRVYMNQVKWNPTTPFMGLSWSRIGYQGQKIQNLVPWDQKKLLKNFFTLSQYGTMRLYCWGLKKKQFLGLNWLATYRVLILDYHLGKKIKLILRPQKVVYVNGQVKRKLLKLFLGRKMIPFGLFGALTDPNVSPGTQKGLETLKLVQYLCYR